MFVLSCVDKPPLVKKILRKKQTQFEMKKKQRFFCVICFGEVFTFLPLHSQGRDVSSLFSTLINVYKLLP